MAGDAALQRQWDSGYSKQQGTRPQTLGYGLADSPTGQMPPGSWRSSTSWMDCDGHPENVLSQATSCSTT